MPNAMAGFLLLTKMVRLRDMQQFWLRCVVVRSMMVISEYAYLADLVVRAAYRGRGIGRELIAKAETYARDEGAKWLRVCVLAENEGARRLYNTSGFSELYVDFEKDLTARAGHA